MLQIYLKGHDNYYGIADVVRAFFGKTVEDRENGRVYCECAPDVTLTSVIEEGGISRCFSDDGKTDCKTTPVTDPVSVKREVKRSAYLAMVKVSGREIPWGCLTGIRPTLVAGEEDDPKELSDKYYVRPDKAELAVRTGRNEQRLLELVPPEDINIYVGIPFCPSRCEYCSFVSSDISHHMGRLPAYLDALEKEIKTVAPHLRRKVSTIYLGGGTPTVFDDDGFKRLMDIITDNIAITDNTEFTVEAGRPDTITEAKLRAMKDKGVKRICINPQTLNSGTLQKLNRRHTADDFRNVFRMAGETGFGIINTDLIAGLKYEDDTDFIDSVKGIAELRPANVTIHTLYKKRRAAISAEDVLTEDDGRVDRAVSEGYRILEENGYIPYYMYRQKDTGHGLENTGFALPGTECLYNVAMMTDARDILSFGAGGMSKRVFGQEGNKFRVERCPCIKDVIGYMNDAEEMAARKIDFFDIM